MKAVISILHYYLITHVICYLYSRKCISTLIAASLQNENVVSVNISRILANTFAIRLNMRPDCGCIVFLTEYTVYVSYIFLVLFLRALCIYYNIGASVHRELYASKSCNMFAHSFRPLGSLFIHFYYLSCTFRPCYSLFFLFPPLPLPPPCTAIWKYSWEQEEKRGGVIVCREILFWDQPRWSFYCRFDKSRTLALSS